MSAISYPSFFFFFYFISHVIGFLRDRKTSLQRGGRDSLRDEDSQQEETDEEGGNLR